MMEKIEWNEEMSVGVVEIDEQHKKFFFLFNTMFDALLEPNVEEIRKKILKELMDYTYYHFKCEHEYMKKIGYPDVMRHDRMHRNFGDEVYKHFRASIENYSINNHEILTMLRNWIDDHILIEDKKLTDFVKQTQLT